MTGNWLNLSWESLGTCPSIGSETEVKWIFLSVRLSRATGQEGRNGKKILTLCFREQGSWSGKATGAPFFYAGVLVAMLGSKIIQRATVFSLTFISQLCLEGPINREEWTNSVPEESSGSRQSNLLTRWEVNKSWNEKQGGNEALSPLLLSYVHLGINVLKEFRTLHTQWMLTSEKKRIRKCHI